MNTGRDQRQFERFDARIQIQFSNGSEYQKAYSMNISKGGIFIETETLPDPNANIELIMDLSELHSDQLTWTVEQLKSVQLKGRVVRSMSMAERGQTLHKVAIQFLDMPPATQVLFDQLYELSST